EALGPWLHRVAYRISLTAKANATVRRHHERRVADMAPASRSDRAEWLDGQLLQAEVDRLPLKYRLPVVLCYLADRTRGEAAGDLGGPVGRVRGRLARPAPCSGPGWSAAVSYCRPAAASRSWQSRPRWENRH